MERSRLKSIILMILALLNLFLLGSMGIRMVQERNSRAGIAAELTELFAADGVRLASGDIPAELPPSGRVPIRSTEEEETMAAFFLGEKLTATDEGGGIYLCQSDGGQALFRSGGAFEILLRSPGEDAETFCRSFCKTFGYEDLRFDLSDGTGTAAAVRVLDGYPVVGAGVSFRVENGRLTAVSGVLIPSEYTASDGGSMTAATALTRFLEDRRTSGSVVSSVSDIYLCYELQNTTATPMALAPSWCIVTNTGNYYVNCSGASGSHS